MAFGQVCQDERASQVELALEKAGLPLQHRIRRGQLPQDLLQTAAMLHATGDELKQLESAQGRSWQPSQNTTSLGLQQLQHALLGMQEDISKALNMLDSGHVARSYERHSRMKCIQGLLEGQLSIVESALSLPQFSSANNPRDNDARYAMR